MLSGDTKSKHENKNERKSGVDNLTNPTLAGMIAREREAKAPKVEAGKTPEREMMQVSCALIKQTFLFGARLQSFKTP